jgi:cell division protein YceG involved in septum cleavage
MNRTADYIMEGSRYYQLNKKRIWKFGMAVLLLVVIFSVFFITKTVTAQRAADRTKQVTTVEVKKGDTLWDIASLYFTDEYDDLNEYIEEIKDSNGLVSDEIHAGNYIIIPYYADASEHSIMME